MSPEQATTSAEIIENLPAEQEAQSDRSVYGEPAIVDDQPKGRGRPPLSSYMRIIEPDEDDEFATSRESVDENFKFYGILMRKQGAHFERLETIKRKNAVCKSDVRLQYGAGRYQIRQKKDDGTVQAIDFFLDEPQNNSPASTASKETPQLDLHNLRDQEALRQQIYQTEAGKVKTEMDHLRGRIHDLERECDRKSKRLRELREEMLEQERSGFHHSQDQLEQVRSQMETLKEKNRRLEFEKFELQMGLKHAGIDTEGTTGMERLVQMASDHPEVVEKLSHTLGSFLSSFVVTPNQITEQPRQLPENNPEASEPTLSELKSSPAAQTPNENETMDITPHLHQLKHVLLDHSLALLTQGSGEVDGSSLKALIDQNVHSFKQNGLQIPTRFWVDLSRELVSRSLSGGIEGSRVAAILRPILSNFSVITSTLPYLPARQAASMLTTQFGIETTSAEMRFLTSVIEVLKEKLRQG